MVQVSLSVENNGEVDEDNGVMLVTVSLTGNLNRDVVVNIATSSGTGITLLCCENWCCIDNKFIFF